MVLLAAAFRLIAGRSSNAQIVMRTLRATELRAQSSHDASVLRHLRKGMQLRVENLCVDTNFVGVAIREAFPGSTKDPVIGWIAINDIGLSVRGTQLIEMLKPSIGRTVEHPDLPPQIPDRVHVTP